MTPEQRLFFERQQQAFLNAQRKKMQQGIQSQSPASATSSPAPGQMSPSPQNAILQQQAAMRGGKKTPKSRPAALVSPLPTTPTSPIIATAETKPYEPAPELTKAQQDNLKTYMLRDELYQKSLEQQGMRLNGLVQEKRKLGDQLNHDRQLRTKYGGYVFGKGYDGYGNGSTGSTFRVVMPHERKRPRRATSEVDMSVKKLRMAADFREDLVPIRLDLEIEGYKLRDTFTWNLHERLVSADQFAAILCEDFRLPAHLFTHQIAKAIREQVSDYHSHAYDVTMLEADGFAPEPQPAHKDDELRILVKLDITVGNISLVDQFEWDINNPRNNPEQFAFTLATELGLGGEFRTAIAHSIREQTQIYTKSLFLVGHPFDGTPVQDDDLRYTFLPTVGGISRDDDGAELHTPRLVELTHAELEKLEKDGERDARRKRRQTRGRRGIILPDREPPKTHRMIPGQNYIVTNDINDETGERIVIQNIGPFRKSNSNGYDSFAVIADRYGGGGSAAVTDRGRRAKMQSGLADHYAKPVHMVPPRISNRPPPNYYDYGNDEWHCLNCGVPETVAIGRRKGPKGEKTLCGLCGIYYHKHNRSRPVEFSRDKDFHLDLMTKTNPKLAQQMHAKNAELTGGDAGLATIGTSTPLSPAVATGRDGTIDTPEMTAVSPIEVRHRSMSQMSPPALSNEIPEYYVRAADDLRRSYPNDRFELVSKAPGEWRIKCHDCPGKSYKPGERDLDNFEIHLKNRQHRANVDARLGP